MSRTLRPAVPVEAAVGCVVGVSRTTVLVSPVSITSVAIRTAPMTSTIRPPRTPERRLASELLVVMYGGLVRPPYVSINVHESSTDVLRTRRAGGNGDESTHPVEDAAAAQLPAHRLALAQAGRSGRARVVAVRPQAVGVGL